MADYRARGLDFARAAICIRRAGGNNHTAAEMAAATYGPNDPATIFVRALVNKAAVGGAYTSGSSGWGGSKIAEQVLNDFIGLVDEVAAIRRIQARPAPVSVKLSGLGTGASAGWVGEALPAPVTSMAFVNGGLPPLAIKAIAAITKELIDMGAPGSDLWIRDELVRACASAINTKFLSDDAAAAGVSPAGILNGVTDIEATTDVAYDLRALVADFQGDPSRSVFIANSEIFTAIQSFQHQFCGLRGGELLTAPCIATREAPAQTLILIDGSGIAIGDGGVEVDIADQASLEMLDGSLQQNGRTGGTGTGVAMVSLWQLGCVGIRVTRHMNWAPLRPCVSFLSGVQYEEVSA